MSKTPYQILDIKKPKSVYLNKRQCVDAAENNCLKQASLFYPPKNQEDTTQLAEYINAYFTIREEMNFSIITKEEMEEKLAKCKWNYYINQIKKETNQALNLLLQEIARIKWLETNELVNEKEQFIKKINELKTEIKENLYTQINELKQRNVNNRYDIADADTKLHAIRSSEGMTVLNDITTTLKEMKYAPKDTGKDITQLEDAHKKYVKKCEENSSWSKFGKSIGALVIAGMGFVVGALIGSTLNLIAGVFDPPLLAFLPLTFYYCGAKAAACSYDLAEIPAGTLKPALMLQTPFYTAAADAAQAGCQFFHRAQEISTDSKKSEVQEHHVDSMLLCTHR